MNQNPLLDFNFLYELDHNRNRTTFARITSLNTNNYPIERIEGVVTAGSITLDGGSAVRRVCNLTLTTGKLNINNVYWSLTTRVKVEIGLKNDLVIYNKETDTNIDYTKMYPDIIWFPQGVYILTDFKTQAQVNNYTITLQGKDKMCLLNGDIGGVFNAETQLDHERVEQEDGTWINEKRSIAYIIRELIHHYAQESFHNIIIRGIDTLSLKILKNNATTLYYVENIATGKLTDIFCANAISLMAPHKTYFYYDLPTLSVDFNNLLDGFEFYTPVDEDNSSLIAHAGTIIIDQDYTKYHVLKINKGEDLGYQLSETYYPEELIAGVGDTVTSILDKIVKTFGAFEYFYNLDGQFVFQEKQTYIKTPWNNMSWNMELDDESWVPPAMVSSQIKYAFEGSKIVSAYQNSPSLGNIKNDFTVWGKKKLSSGIELPIHMRYAIDVKPDFYASYPKTDTIILASGETKTVGPYQDIYLTQNKYKEIEQLISEDSSSGISIGGLINKKTPPDYIYAAMEGTGEDPNLCWWTVCDWAEYYKLLTGAYPVGAMSRFCRTTFTAAPLQLPDGTSLNVSRTAIMDIDATTGNVFNSRGKPLLLGNVTYYSWSGLQHSLGGCGHTFQIFQSLHEKYNVDSWVYKPIIPDGGASLEYDIPTNDGFKYHIVDWREIIFQMAKDYYLHNHDDDYEIMLNRNNTISQFNIRLFEHGRTGYEQYYHDIEGFWRLLYAPQDYVDNYNTDKAKISAYTINKDDFYKEITDDNGNVIERKFIGPWNKNIIEEPSSLIFWFDFFEADSLGLGQFSVPAIGNRPKNQTNDSIRALIYKDVPDVVLIDQEEYDKYATTGRLLDGYNYYILNDILSEYIENNQITISSRSVTAQESIDDLLYNYAYCNETITITSVPIYYLEPNTIISARDEERMVHGYYIINKITLPLDYKGTMQITAIKVPERAY